MVFMRTMECLVTIVGQGSLTQASAVLHVSQPTAGPGCPGQTCMPYHGGEPLT